MSSSAYRKTGHNDLSPPAFRRLLKWLGGDADSEGEQYLEMRRRLAAYFDRKNCQTRDDLAEEVLDRVARRLEEEGEIQSDAPARYCYITARFVFMEHLRQAKKLEGAVEQLGRSHNYERTLESEAADEKELRHSCLDACIQKLESHHREIIMRYIACQQKFRKTSSSWHRFLGCEDSQGFGTENSFPVNEIGKEFRCLCFVGSSAAEFRPRFRWATKTRIRSSAISIEN